MKEVVVRKISFKSCFDKVCGILTGYEIGVDDICIFSNEAGRLESHAQQEFTRAFADNEAVELVYADEGYPNTIPWFKPEFSPDTLESFFYIGNVFAIKGEALEKITDDICIYELVLQLSKHNGFCHIPKVLFVNDSDEQALKLEGFQDSDFKSHHVFNDNEQVSIIIPSKDNSTVLENCIRSLKEKTLYHNYEVIVVDNGSCESQKSCITKLAKDCGFKYIYDKAKFNFSKMCNTGARLAGGDYLLFLNDDIEIIDGKWIHNMLRSAVNNHSGAVGAKLYYPDMSIQHVGITNMGIGPAHKTGQYHGHDLANYNMIAVTGACLMVKRSLFDSIGGFDEEFPVAYNDVEFCFRLYEAGYFNVVRNDAILIHHESLSRGKDTSNEKKKRLTAEKHKLYEKHPGLKAYDPFYSPNLVQWKWDTEYNENIIYEYDKEITPVVLSKAQRNKLPKEHTNRYIRKITGENQLILNIDGVDYIDSIENMYNKDMILVRGWVALVGHDNSDLCCKKHLLLKSCTDESTVYEMEIIPMQRKDVEALSLENTKNSDNSGINVFFDEKKIPNGEYTIGVLFENNRRFVKWSTDTIKR